MEGGFGALLPLPRTSSEAWDHLKGRHAAGLLIRNSVPASWGQIRRNCFLVKWRLLRQLDQVEFLQRMLGAKHDVFEGKKRNICYFYIALPCKCGVLVLSSQFSSQINFSLEGKWAGEGADPDLELGGGS